MHWYTSIDCWHHLRNVWFGAVIKKLGENLEEVLGHDLEQIHFSLRVTTDIGNIIRAIEKYFGEQANYTKGKGSMYYDYMRRYHQGVYLSQSLGHVAELVKILV